MPEDIEYLKTKGCLSIPECNLRNALIRCFIEFVNPDMPILDLASFLGAAADLDDSVPQISLLLLQAVFFAASSYVGMDHLLAAGFPDRKTARRAFFQRTKVSHLNGGGENGVEAYHFRDS